MALADVPGLVTMLGMVVIIFLVLRRRAGKMRAEAAARAEAVSHGGEAAVNLGGIYVQLDRSLFEAAMAAPVAQRRPDAEQTYPVSAYPASVGCLCRPASAAEPFGRLCDPCEAARFGPPRLMPAPEPVEVVWNGDKWAG